MSEVKDSDEWRCFLNFEQDLGAFDNWGGEVTAITKKMISGEVTEHESFEMDPMAIHEPTMHGFILNKA